MSKTLSEKEILAMLKDLNNVHEDIRLELIAQYDNLDEMDRLRKLAIERSKS